MKIFAYHFNTDASSEAIHKRLNEIKVQPLTERNRKIKDDPIRIESMQYKSGVWLMDFVKIRMDHGPAKGGLRKEVQGFDLDDDEGFCEETGVLLNLETKMMIAQYNHHGARVGAIVEYLSHFDHTAAWSTSADPVLDQSIEHRLKSKTIFNKFELAFYQREFTKSELDQNRPLALAAEAAASAGANKVNVTFSATGADNTLGQNMWKLAHWILEKVRLTERSGIKTAKISGKDSPEDSSELLDLVAHRISTQVEIKSGSDKRYPRKRRWDALERSFAEWSRDDIL